LIPPQNSTDSASGHGRDVKTHISFVLAVLFLSTVLGASILPVQPAFFTGDSIVYLSFKGMLNSVLSFSLLSKKRYETINVSESDVLGESSNPVNFPEVTLKVVTRSMIDRGGG